MAIPLNAIKRGLLNNDSAESLLLKWKLTTLPTFNSMSAEAGKNFPMIDKARILQWLFL